MRRDHGLVDEELYPYYQDVYDHILRVTESTDALRDLVSTIVETNLSLRDFRTNQVMKKVTSWAAIIAVPTLITGWYGMNVPYPGLRPALGSSSAATILIIAVLRQCSTCCSSGTNGCDVVTIDDIRPLALSLPARLRSARPRSGEVPRRAVRVARVLSRRDDDGLRVSEGGARGPRRRPSPTSSSMPKKSDMRYNWVVVRLDQIDEDEARELVLDAWRMVVPKKVAAEHLGD